MLRKLSRSHITNLISQIDARRILQEVKESENNFPKFDTLLTEKAIHIAYTLISCGCSLVEYKDSVPNEGQHGFICSKTILICFYSIKKC
jgi:hypothetical protein